MSKKKGVSAEEKKTRMLELFYEKKEFFQLKELEKLGPKEKGVVAQSVKDVIQTLVDDGLVDTDKIGTSIYYWAYPNKVKVLREQRLNELNCAIEEKNKKLEAARAALESSNVDKGESDERTEIMKRLEKLRSRKEELTKTLANYSDFDAETLENLKKDTQKNKDAANRWTDNIFSLKSWCKSKFMVEESTLDKQFGIPVDFDYIE